MVYIHTLYLLNTRIEPHNDNKYNNSTNTLILLVVTKILREGCSNSSGLGWRLQYIFLLFDRRFYVMKHDYIYYIADGMGNIYR